jgi:hypothetical protein
MGRIASLAYPPPEDASVTIARRRPSALDVIAPLPNVPTVRPPAPEIDMPVSVGDRPAPDAVIPVGRLRRCTFRRIDQVSALPGRAALTSYEVMCLYGAEEALPLGDLDAARPICEACTAAGIFRPDED